MNNTLRGSSESIVGEAAAHVCVYRVRNAKTSTYTMYKVKIEDV